MTSMTTSAAAPADPPPQPSRRHAPHLHEVDMVRLLTFACVIAVHVTSRTIDDADAGMWVMLGMIHFTRQTFFALSAFVLMYSYAYNPRPMRRFWPRRFLLVGVPYVTWSAIYFLYGSLPLHSGESLWGLVPEFLVDLVTGQAWGHMYFLLVTMQLYLLFPVLRAVVVRARGHHASLLAGAGLFQMLLNAWYMYAPDLPEPVSMMGESLFLSYVFTFTLGAVTADHREKVFAWVRSHHGTVALIVILGVLGFLGVFAVNRLGLGYQLYHSGTPLQPMMVVWSLIVDLLLLTLGATWADHRRPGSFWDRALKRTSDWSFGIFLIHPMLISLLLRANHRWMLMTIPHPWLTLVLYLMVVTLSLMLVAVIRHTPLSLALTGRPLRARARPTAMK